MNKTKTKKKNSKKIEIKKVTKSTKKISNKKDKTAKPQKSRGAKRELDDLLDKKKENTFFEKKFLFEKVKSKLGRKETFKKKDSFIDAGVLQEDGFFSGIKHFFKKINWFRVVVYVVSLTAIIFLISKIISLSAQISIISRENQELKEKTVQDKKDINEELSSVQNFLKELKKKMGSEEDPSTLKKGSIEGSIAFPGTYIPEDITVCAENLETKKQYCSQEIKDEKYTEGVGYKIDLPIGKYTVFASTPAWENYRAYYSDFVLCGMKDECQSHNAIEITVEEGKNLGGIEPNDWYNQK